MLNEFASECGLDFSNVVHATDCQKNWISESNLGARRMLDYVLQNASLQVKSAGATNALNLGSDHRAVQACFSLPRPVLRERGTKLQVKQVDWKKYGKSIGKFFFFLVMEDDDHKPQHQIATQTHESQGPTTNVPKHEPRLNRRTDRHQAINLMLRATKVANKLCI